ncbi:hypothetical protein SAMN06265795_10872 [Noviherbaspirillum humi]|uniref:Uncharacterized protein n=1 Tax=Noviherbaspirillum humi TaxID=1688639 RepID=A0A239I395_9BURK|nr:hypothetical protein [Noviherbaspirillum humi]SNS87553.1 hypothetical protein SAMN06265795_10872 [Noviherbaspirillum humi]
MKNIDLPGWDANDWMALLGGAWLRLTPSQRDARIRKLFDCSSPSTFRRLPPLPRREDYADDEAFFEARYEWQSCVGRIIATARMDGAIRAGADDGAEGIPSRDPLDAAFRLWERQQIRQ